MTHTRKRYPFNVLNIPEVSSITRDVPLFRYSVRKEKEKRRPDRLRTPQYALSELF